MKKILLAIVLIATANLAQAQGITVNEEPAITRMMEVYSSVNKVKMAEQTIDGFRIQLVATTDRRKVDQYQSAFGGKYPGVFVGWSQAQPYYRVRVGGFTNRTDATKFLQSIKGDYPDAYIVADRVKTTELTTY